MNAAAFEHMDTVLADDLALLRAELGRPVLAGLCGPQGSGKSHTGERLVRRLRARGLGAIARSLDDFYLPKRDREALARKVHPLLATRGVPGTHDVALLGATLARLAGAADTDITALPTFDKTTDDRAPDTAWPAYKGRPDIILLEGWCIGARPQPASALAHPVNALERTEDADGAWRTRINRELAGHYTELFGRLDRRYLLEPPSFDAVFRWRAEQEAGLDRSAEGARPPMSELELRRFIAHYERITRWLMEDEPADLVIEIGEDRMPRRLRWTARGT